jgi:hypothetical protein
LIGRCSFWAFLDHINHFIKHQFKMAEDNAEDILNNYKRMLAECQQIATKINEVDSQQFFVIHFVVT